MFPYSTKPGQDHLPFWFTDLISAMDTLSAWGFSKDEPQIEAGMMWLAAHQQNNRLWKLRILKNRRNDTDVWLSLAICRILKRLHPS